MSKVLFIPLNTNHVAIFHGIIRSLSCDYAVLCHDRISDSMRYHTEYILRNLEIDYHHFEKRISRSPDDNVILKISKFVKMRRIIRDVLKHISADVVVLAMDNDPIAQLVIEQCNDLGMKKVLVQEALIRPYEYTMRQTYLSDYAYNLLRLCRIYLNYSQYGTGGCDKILVGGVIARDILKSRGVSVDKIAVVGLPKYDEFFNKIRKIRPINNEKKVYLFAASTRVLDDASSITFVKEMVQSTNKLQVYLIIKLHPRGPVEPSDVYKLIDCNDTPFVKITKEGDDTFSLLTKSDILIAVSSTVILEALMMDKECVVASYLAGESRLQYDEYDALHSIESQKDIYNAMKTAMMFKKSWDNKKRLLEDELYKLDGKAGERAANLIECMISK